MRVTLISSPSPSFGQLLYQFIEQRGGPVEDRKCLPMIMNCGVRGRGDRRCDPLSPRVNAHEPGFGSSSCRFRVYCQSNVLFGFRETASTATDRPVQTLGETGRSDYANCNCTNHKARTLCQLCLQNSHVIPFNRHCLPPSKDDSYQFIFYGM